MKIGVLGNGFIGLNLIKDLDAISITRENYDELKHENYDLLINAAGSSNKVLAEKDPLTDLTKNSNETLKILLDFSFDRYLHLSSCELYGDLENCPNEDTGINAMYLSNYGLSKYISELLVMKYAKKWVILRLNGVIGLNLRKGIMWDLLFGDRLFVSKESEFQFIHTSFISKFINKITKWGQIYNLTGDDQVKISDIMKITGEIPSPSKPVIKHYIDTCKANKIMKIPTSWESVEMILNDINT